ncbi:MAG: sensor histidine kinase [Flavitalea sp.]
MDSYKDFAEFFDVQPQAIIWHKPLLNGLGEIVDFEFRYWNEQGLRYLNLNSREEGKGMTIQNTNRLTPELKISIFNEMRSIIDTGNVSESSLFNPVLNKYVKVLRSGLRGGILTVVQDITKEKRIIEELEIKQQQLEEQKLLMDNLLSHSPAGISVTETIKNSEGEIIDGKTILSNEIAAKYLGIPLDLMLSKTIKEIDPGLFDSPIFIMALDTLRTGIPFNTQYYYSPGNKWLEMSVAKMDENRLINVFLDITATKESHLRQQELLEELKRSNSNLEEFAFAASHDLKEPIRKIHFFSERIKHLVTEKLNADELKMFGRLESATQRMSILVDDLLAFSQVSLKPFEKEQVDLGNILSQILEDLDLEILEKRASIKIEKLPVLRGYHHQLQQLFQNLISNAIKYRKIGIDPEIVVSCRKTGTKKSRFPVSADDNNREYYEISVQDNGIGFEQKDADRIFNVFQRLHGNTEYKGTGIGLAIARKVAQNHNGYIYAKSSLGEGSTFLVYLPVL